MGGSRFKSHEENFAYYRKRVDVIMGDDTQIKVWIGSVRMTLGKTQFKRVHLLQFWKVVGGKSC